MADPKRGPSGPTGAKERPRTHPPADLAARIALGESLASIADATNCDRHAIGRWAKSPEIIEEVARIQAEAGSVVIARLQSLAEPAVAALGRVLTANKCEACGRGASDDHAQIKAANSILDRVSAPKRTEVVIPTTNDDPDRVILEEAVSILRRRGLHELANGLQAALA